MTASRGGKGCKPIVVPDLESSLAAEGAEHCPIGLCGAEGQDALQVPIRTAIAFICLKVLKDSFQLKSIKVGPQ